jgi:hypothetical protein
MNNRFKSIMNNRFYRNLKPEQLKRRFGAQIQTFKKMVNALEQFLLENSQYSGSQESEVCPMPCLANALFGQCPVWPMPNALSQIVPHVTEKGYINEDVEAP